MKIKVGINGLGRIGKCVFLQLLNNPKFEIKAINAVNLNLKELEDYLNYDSAHNVKIDNFEIVNLEESEFIVNNQKIKLLSDRNPDKLKWKKYDCQYLIDATGAFLTQEKCAQHDIDYVVMSAPAKDDSASFIYGANHEKYNGEKIVSASSCTTNCLAPMLRLINDTYEINNCNFTTIHAATASQYPVDVFKKSARTNRSIFNNIIPHTTGASSSISKILPFIKDKIFGTSVRVPVLNCSLLDLNIEFDKNITISDIEKLIDESNLKNIVYKNIDKKLVSSDFNTTTIPTNLDLKASMNIGENKVKLMLWYDNEWSYSSQLIRLVEHMYEYNTRIKDKYYLKNLNLVNKNVVARFDFNITMNGDKIVDDYRIVSAIPTIKYILSQNPNRLLLVTHYGRPSLNEKKYSVKFMVDILEKYLNDKVKFLESGISDETLSKLDKGIYLLENIRYNYYETNYKYIEKNIENPLLNLYRNFGDVFIIDAFGCLHREHMSICDINYSKKEYGYGLLIEKEFSNINTILSNKNLKILGIIGGAKIVDKMPFINRLKELPNTRLFICGGLAKHYEEYYNNVLVMNYGKGNEKINDEPKELSLIDVKNSECNFYDISKKSLEVLKTEIDNADIIFWNGPIGVIEHDIYKKGSIEVADYLKNIKNKKIIIGGGETASLFNKDSEDIYISTGGGALLDYIQKGTSIYGLKAFTK